MLFETCYYVVEMIDGDYAHLKLVDIIRGNHILTGVFFFMELLLVSFFVC